MNYLWDKNTIASKSEMQSTFKNELGCIPERWPLIIFTHFTLLFFSFPRQHEWKIVHYLLLFFYCLCSTKRRCHIHSTSPRPNHRQSDQNYESWIIIGFVTRFATINNSNYSPAQNNTSKTQFRAHWSTKNFVIVKDLVMLLAAAEWK